MRLYLIDEHAMRDSIHRAQVTPVPTSAELSAMVSEDAQYMVYGGDAILDVSGPLSYKFDVWSFLFGGSSYKGLMHAIQVANQDTEVDRIVMVMDTPGGEVTGLREMSAAVRNSRKPVVAFVDPMCASAGLYIASQCSEIVSVESGEIGSLGCQCVAISMSEAFSKSGVDIKVIRAAISPKKNMAHPYEPMTEESIDYLQGRVDKFGMEFVEAVAAGRKRSVDYVLENFGQGAMLDSEDALQVGLIDRVGDLQTVLNGYSKRKPGRRASLRL